MFEKFTDRARMVMAMANQEASRFNHEFVGTEHILLGLLRVSFLKDGKAADILKHFDVDIQMLCLEVDKLFEGRTGHDKDTRGKIRETSGATRVIEHAIVECRSQGHRDVGTEHILLGLLKVDDEIAAQVLVNLGIKIDSVRQEVEKLK